MLPCLDISHRPGYGHVLLLNITKISIEMKTFIIFTIIPKIIRTNWTLAEYNNNYTKIIMILIKTIRIVKQNYYHYNEIIIGLY